MFITLLNNKNKKKMKIFVPLHFKEPAHTLLPKTNPPKCWYSDLTALILQFHLASFFFLHNHPITVTLYHEEHMIKDLHIGNL